MVKASVQAVLYCEGCVAFLVPLKILCTLHQLFIGGSGASYSNSCFNGFLHEFHELIFGSLFLQVLSGESLMLFAAQFPSPKNEKKWLISLNHTLKSGMRWRYVQTLR